MKDKEAEQTIQISKPLHRTGKNWTKPVFVTQLRPIIWSVSYLKEKKKDQLVDLYDWTKHIILKYVNNGWEKEIIQTSSLGFRLNKRSLFE